MAQVTFGQRAEIERRLRAGAPVQRVARDLGLAWRTVNRIRDEAGMPPRSRGRRATAPLLHRWAQHAVLVDGGHVRWDGPRDRRMPEINHRGRHYPVRRLAFVWANGREPVGHVLPECDMPEDCVAPTHLDDTAGRQRVREALAALLGIANAEECRRGHDQAVWRRRLPDGTAYCHACVRERQGLG
ncbi:hypothetical protein [Streptomyces sp. NBRC 109706]|uniref:hypothetical protein n=1 Tax=Streptomyces sp. NBRC 109706 TaxID=1550035 RepID=UPI0007836995|nr:hypothetical protein [Streptomyces sp. NBRC 109706]